MGLLDKLTAGDGSTLSFSDGNTPFTNPLSTKQSQLHYNSVTDQPGYSVNGDQFSIVNSDFQQYEDGNNNFLPNSTQLDLLDPITADPDNKPKYTPIPGQTYSDLYNKF
jgi:hypothetical protein